MLVRTPRFKAWFGDWESLFLQNQFDQFVDRALTENDPREEFKLRSVTNEEAREVFRQGGVDISGMDHVVSAQWLKHAYKKHGTPYESAREKGQQRQLTKEDLLNIITVVDGYDQLTVQKREANKTSIIYSKRFDDGHIEYVERILETSKKHKPRLVTKTAWVKSLTGVKSSLPRVYAPERNLNLAFTHGRINTATVSKVIDEKRRADDGVSRDEGGCQ